MEAPLVSVLAVVGSDRKRLKRLFRALTKQTIRDRLELILVDLAPEESEKIDLPPGIAGRVFSQPGSWDWGAARSKAVREAKASIVAFLEDHTIPDPRWAEEVAAKFEESGPETDSVCYAFVNGSPDTWFYKSVFMAEYGILSQPLPEGRPPSSTANNIAYRRDILLELGDKLDELLELDFFLQSYLGPGFKVVSAPRAVLAHQTNSSLRDLVVGHFGFARLFANRRIGWEEWGEIKRLAGALSVPFLVPLLRIKRLFFALKGRSLTGVALRGLPLIFLLYLAGALGESVGLLCRKRYSAKEIIWLELVAPRA